VAIEHPCRRHNATGEWWDAAPWKGEHQHLLSQGAGGQPVPLAAGAPCCWPRTMAAPVSVLTGAAGTLNFGSNEAQVPQRTPAAKGHPRRPIDALPTT